MKTTINKHLFITSYKGILGKLKENSSSGTLIRLGWFLFIYFIGRYVVFFLEETTLFSLLHQPFLWSINQVSTGFLGLFYSDLTSTHNYIVIINNVEVIQLFPGCSGLQPLLRITFILLFYPLPWKTKTYLFPLSWLIILIAATIHFILLIPIAFHWPEYYNLSHNWLTRIIFYGFYFCTWLIWEKIGYPKRSLSGVYEQES